MKYYCNNSYELMQADGDCGDCMLCPQKLYLDLTEDCNLWCKMCREKKSICGRTMDAALFQRLVDETAPFVRSYSLFNWGEPLLIREFRQRVRYVNQKKRRDCTVDISTNGMLLNKSMINFLVQERVFVTISVDGADKTTFEAIRRGADFERVMQNAQSAAAAYGKFPPHQSPSFYISIQQENQNQILKICTLARDLGIKRIGCGIVTSPKEFAPDQNKALCRELEKAYQFIEDNGMFLDLYPTRVGDYVYADGRYQAASNFLIHTICHAPLVSATVDYTGDVYLCCNAGACVGSVSEGSFLELWKSARYNQLRKQVNIPSEQPKKCKACAWFNRNSQTIGG